MNTTVTDVAKPPKGWGQDEISKFLDLIRNNHFATFERKRGEYAQLRNIGDCFVRVKEHFVNPKDELLPLFFGRAHGAYFTACGLALAGQSPETFLLLRHCVEAAGYALLIHQKPALGSLWVNRSVDKKSVRDAFKFGVTRAAIESVDKKLASLFEML